MSEENVRIVMSLYDMFRRGDNESPFALYDEEIVWDMDLAIPDLAAVYRGHDGIREFWRSWLTAWERIEFETVEVTEPADDAVLVEIQQRARGRSSGAEADYRWFQVWRLRDGKVIASHGRRTREEALGAAGLD